MHAVVREVPAQWLEERARLGLDRLDEVWEGVLHMPPAPGRIHQSVGTALTMFLGPELAARKIKLQYETEVHRPGAGGSDYRVADLVFFREDQPGLALTARGFEGAPLAVLEILSPNDETHEKLDFYAALGVAEVIVIDPHSRRAEIFRLAGSRYVAVSADDRGRVHAASLDARFSTVPGDEPALRVECGGAVRDV